MTLKFFRAKDYSNFGDELNPLIFNYLFGQQFNNPKLHENNFYGIGSIIDSRIKETEKAILFGTGIRDITALYNTSNWDVRFVRGPISANILGIKSTKVIADGAYCLLTTPELIPKVEKKNFSFSIMPHYKQMDKINWEFIAKITGVHIIDPRNEASLILNEIAQTENLITVAMHGAIVADILRVPWVRLKMEAVGSEAPFISDLKWLDFLIPLELKNDYCQVKNYSPYHKPWSIWLWIYYYEIIRQIQSVKKSTLFQLSKKEKLEEIKEKILKEIQRFKNEYQ